LSWFHLLGLRDVIIVVLAAAYIYAIKSPRGLSAKWVGCYQQ
jgi:hypothetical protein